VNNKVRSNTDFTKISTFVEKVFNLGALALLFFEKKQNRENH